jgi:hypothetical protein
MIQQYKDKIQGTNEFKGTLQEYLKASLESDDKYCKGWEFLKANLTQELKEILLNEDYDKIVYNAENVNLIISKLGELDKTLKDQLGSFVYVWKDIKRDIEKEVSEQDLKDKMLSQGYKEGLIFKYTEEDKDDYEKKKDEYYNQFHNLKVKCVLDISKIGLLGSFDSTEEVEGTIHYVKHRGFLMLIPKRSRTRGYPINNRFYYKELKK